MYHGLYFGRCSLILVYLIASLPLTTTCTATASQQPHLPIASALQHASGSRSGVVGYGPRDHDNTIRGGRTRWPPRISQCTHFQSFRGPGLCILARRWIRSGCPDRFIFCISASSGALYFCCTSVRVILKGALTRNLGNGSYDLCPTFRRGIRRWRHRNTSTDSVPPLIHGGTDTAQARRRLQCS